jgi:uncharacterized phage-associated protein
MRSSLTVANRFLALASENGDTLTPMQLLKLVYIAHGWMLGLYGRPLIVDEVQAWQYGPVIPKLYNKLRSYRGGVVTEAIGDPLGAQPLERLEDDIVRQVYDLYGQKTGLALSRITHADGTPWSASYQPGVFGTVISTDLIEDHYSKLAEQAAERAIA